MNYVRFDVHVSIRGHDGVGFRSSAEAEESNSGRTPPRIIPEWRTHAVEFSKTVRLLGAGLAPLARRGPK